MPDYTALLQLADRLAPAFRRSFLEAVDALDEVTLRELLAAVRQDWVSHSSAWGATRHAKPFRSGSAALCEGLPLRGGLAHGVEHRDDVLVTRIGVT